MIRRTIFILLAGALFYPAAAHAADKLTVATLGTVLTDIAQNVGGDAVEITNIIQPGVDPHGFEPTVRDVKKMIDAKVVLASGMGFEPYLPKLSRSLADGPELVIVGDAISPLMVEAPHDDHAHEHGHSHSHGVAGADGKMADPHWWHSVANAKTATNTIRDAFIKADPERKSTYEANAKTYQKKLDALAKWIKLEVAKLPRDRRVMVTSHDALGYFARDYSFTVKPVQGISTSAQPSSKQVRELIDLIKKTNVRAVFAENIENPKILTEITRETGAKMGGILYADGLGATEAATYESMMRHNTTTLVDGLQ